MALRSSLIALALFGGMFGVLRGGGNPSSAAAGFADSHGDVSA